MKKTHFLFYFLFTSILSNAQYYNTALGLNGTALKNQLNFIIKTNHTTNTYSDLWLHFGSTDIKTGNIVWDIYSDIPSSTAPYTFTYQADQCTTSPNAEGICYNREHTWPASYFNDFYPMYADLFHVMPSDYMVNNKRNNFPYGKVNTTTWVSDNGSKLGKTTTYTSFSASNPNHWAFEPIDSFKGDVARNYFYMSTRYKGEDASWYNWEMANGAELTQDAITLLLHWHHLDPVSQKEIDRNNHVFAIQGNRNPFIDYPIFADCIWGNSNCTNLNLIDVQKQNPISVFPNPCNEFVNIKYNTPLDIERIVIVDIFGKTLYKSKSTEEPISTKYFPNGMYYLIIHSKKGNMYTRFTKE